MKTADPFGSAAFFNQCAREDSNLHPVNRDQHLKLARLPVPPLAQVDLGREEYTPIRPATSPPFIALS